MAYRDVLDRRGDWLGTKAPCSHGGIYHVLTQSPTGCGTQHSFLIGFGDMSYAKRSSCDQYLKFQLNNSQ